MTFDTGEEASATEKTVLLIQFLATRGLYVITLLDQCVLPGSLGLCTAGRSGAGACWTRPAEWTHCSHLST